MSSASPTRASQSSGCMLRKRKRSLEGGGGSAERRNVSVRFSHVAIRTHRMELWGGGGVPADDGPPLGLSGDVMEEVDMLRHNRMEQLAHYLGLPYGGPQPQASLAKL